MDTKQDLNNVLADLYEKIKQQHELTLEIYASTQALVRMLQASGKGEAFAAEVGVVKQSEPYRALSLLNRLLDVNIRKLRGQL
jgi:hypothetical protein